MDGIARKSPISATGRDTGILEEPREYERNLPAKFITPPADGHDPRGDAVNSPLLKSLCRRGIVSRPRNMSPFIRRFIPSRCVACAKLVEVPSLVGRISAIYFRDRTLAIVTEDKARDRVESGDSGRERNAVIRPQEPAAARMDFFNGLLRFGPGLTVHNSPATTLQTIQFLQASGPAVVLLSQGGQVLFPFTLAT